MTPNEQQAGQRAFELHNGGFHCAEAVLLAVLEAAGANQNGLVPKMATCFGGGVGRSKEQICGALSGGLMALGCLMGRERAGDDWNGAAKAAVELRDRFKILYGSTECSKIMEVMGPRQSTLCKQLSGETATLACRVWNESNR